MKKYQPLNQSKPVVKMTIGQFKERKARAYAVGQLGGDFTPEFDFEVEAYERAKADESTVQTFIHDKGLPNP